MKHKVSIFRRVCCFSILSCFQSYEFWLSILLLTVKRLRKGPTKRGCNGERDEATEEIGRKAVFGIEPLVVYSFHFAKRLGKAM